MLDVHVSENENKARRGFGCMEKISVIMSSSIQLCLGFFFNLIIKLN